MSHKSGLFQWMQVVSSHMPQLSKPQAMTLALFSFGMVMTRRCGMTTVTHFLALLTGKSEGSLRQRLREWCYDAPDKRGAGRQEIEVSASFAPLLGWIIGWWQQGERQLVLALDATSLRQTFTVLAVSVVYRGCAIPVAWSIVRGTEAGSWQPHWLGLLALLHPAVPKRWRVLALTDRGLYARWLFGAIRQQGWHPFMRINHQGQYRRRHARRWHPLKALVAGKGRIWAARVVCFKSADRQLPCTLLVCWQPDYADPWLVVTDLPVTQAQIACYGWRAWIEAGFKDFKRGGWRWEQTKMTRPERAERLWLVMAVATLWSLSVGGHADGFAFPLLSAGKRTLSGFVQGLNTILVAALQHHPLPMGCFIPDFRNKAPLLC
jgi:hypothetical protein